MTKVTIHEKEIQVYPAAQPDRPVIYLQTFGKEGDRVHKAMQKLDSPDCNLVAISGLDWNHEMTPWDCPPISRMDTPCTGGADEYLSVLTQEIVPQIEADIDGTPSWRGLTGYSLAGLFAVYALYQTDMFSRIATMSGSLWFPDFYEYVTSHEMRIRPDAVYFSLGDKEAKTNNKFLMPVQERTAAIQAYYAKQGIDSVFVLNPGNHYVNGDKRTAQGIDWILRR